MCLIYNYAISKLALAIFILQGSPFTNQLQKDRETLIQQVQVLERKLDVCQSEKESLKTNMIEMQKKVGEKLFV